MSNERPEAFYDLSEASTLTRRLALERSAEPVRSPVRSTETAEGYVRFSADRVRLGRHAESDAAVEESIPPVPWSPEMMGSGGWRHLTGWAVEAVDADAVFVVDESGLIVAAEGILPAEDLEAAGARLLAIFEQTERMLVARGPARTVSVELRRGWLVGLRIAARTQGGDEAALTVGVLVPRPLPSGARGQLLAAFEKKALGI